MKDLGERAMRHGIRLASDMVPNHMGLDSRWVIEHPERFLALPVSPMPRYRFTGPDLSQDDRVSIRLEDGYWDRSDAAVVFQRVDRGSGETRYIYHGNDGTSMPWNDTAQLDYLQADVREAVMATILDVARALPDHPLRRRHDPRSQAHPAALVSGARRSRRRHPDAHRLRHLQRRLRARHAARVLARGRRPGGG